MTTKENLNGLGYTGLSKTPILATFRDETRREVPVVDKNRKLAISGEVGSILRMINVHCFYT